MAGKKRVSIIGSGNWGSVIAKIIGNNVKILPDHCEEVRMWVFEEMVDGMKLTDIINQKHENVKYLPGVQLPSNVVAMSDSACVVKDADVIVFVIPQRFVRKELEELKGNIKEGAYGISLIKGLDVPRPREIQLVSDLIRSTLNIPCAVLMGANLAPEVAKEFFCEATIGCKDSDMAAELKRLFQTNYFRIVTTPDEVTVELCGALKTVVAMGAGFADGLGYGDNTKAACIRLGFMEMMKFIYEFYGDRGPQKMSFFQSCAAGEVIMNIKPDTIRESSGVADLTAYGQRNRKIAHAFVLKRRKSIVEIEQEVLGGSGLSAQGPKTAERINAIIAAKGLESEYPLFTAVHNICIGNLAPEQFLDGLRHHPVHL